MDGGFPGVLNFGLSQDGFGSVEGFRPACRMGPGDPPAGLLWLAPDELSSEWLENQPLFLRLEEHCLKRKHLIGGVVFRLKSSQLLCGQVIKAESHVSAGVRQSPVRIHGWGGLA